MNEQETIDAVSTALTGKFHIGQRVRVRPGMARKNWVGVVREITTTGMLMLSEEGYPDMIEGYDPQCFEPA